MHQHSIPGRIFDAANAIVLFLVSITILYPFWNLLLSSFAPFDEVSSLGLHLWIKRWTLASWRFVFIDNDLFVAYANTLHRAFFGTSLTLLVTFTAAYALSKRDLPGRSFLTVCFVLTMFFSGGLIPTYLLIRSLGLMNSRWVLILPIAMNVYYIIVARNFLMTIDQSMEDSAIIDGAGYWTILLRIMVPLAKPVFVTVGLWAAVEHWNAWFDAMIYLDDRNKQVLAAPHPRHAQGAGLRRAGRGGRRARASASRCRCSRCRRSPSCSPSGRSWWSTRSSRSTSSRASCSAPSRADPARGARVGCFLGFLANRRTNALGWMYVPEDSCRRPDSSGAHRTHRQALG